MDENDPPTTNGQPRRLGGRFVLLDRIGAGGGAVVVRARDRQFSASVAVKLLRSRDPDLQRRFVQESEVLRAIDHPAIVRVLAHDRDGDDLYTVLELLAGPDLCELLARSGPLPWRRVVELGIQIADALEAVHRQGLVHRDVKPANVMVAGADEPMRVKLIDFGVVRITTNYRTPTGASARRPTDMGKALGTPGYLPLEAGLVAANPSFDVFGLGATLYELLTGVLPEEPLRTLREAHPGCDAPDDLDRVLAAALALEPEDRTQTAAEIGRALAAVRAAHPERGAPSSRIDGRYELIGLAGTGARADAHLAVHRGTGRDVVLKFLRSTDPDDVLRFAREAKLLASFDHPALPRFYDYAPEARPPYIAMALAPGQPAVRLCSRSRLRPAEVAAVGVKLAQVLAVVHARGVLHRDVNANNVLIDGDGTVTLLDFGNAELGKKFYDVPAGERRYLTPPEARVVIPSGGIEKLAWSAPEVRAGGGWTDRSDVYSMGHLLFRLLTGKVPTKGADPPSSPLEHVVTCPVEIAAVIESALRVDPEDRPSAAQFAEKLRDALESDEAEFTRAVVAATPAARPALRLVTAEPQPRADWTGHPLPEASAEPDPPPLFVTPPTVPRRSPTVLAALAMTALVTLVVAWWGARHLSAEPAPTAKLAMRIDPPAPQGPATFSPANAGQAAIPVAPPPTPGTMQEALNAATPALKRCSQQAHGLLFVNFTVVEGGEAFAVSVPERTDEAVDRCVHDATANLRFQPHRRAETFTEEYNP